MPAVLRARRRLRLRRARHQGGARRRRVDHQRPEGLEHARPPRRLRHAGHPLEPRPAQAQGHDLLRARHAGPRGRGAAAAPDHRRGRVQRGLHDRRAGTRRPPHRRRGRRLARLTHHPDERALRDRRRFGWGQQAPARRSGQRCRRRLERARPERTDRRPQGRADAAVGPRRGRPPHQHARRRARPSRQPRARDVDRQARVLRVQQAALQLLHRSHGHGGPGRVRLHLPPAGRTRRQRRGQGVCSTRSSACEPTRSRAVPRRSSATSSASRCSACPANPGWTKTSAGSTCRAADAWPSRPGDLGAPTIVV